jgi:hypothetical protein
MMLIIQNQYPFILNGGRKKQSEESAEERERERKRAD